MQDCQAVPITPKENLFLLLRVLRMNSISYPQDDYFILIHIHYLAFVHFITLKHFASTISFIIYCLSYLFCNWQDTHWICVPFQSNICSMRQSAKQSLPRLPSLSRNTDFLLWSWYKSPTTLVAIYWSPQWGGGPPGSSHGKLSWL